MITAASYLYALTYNLDANGWLYVFTVICDLGVVSAIYDGATKRNK